MAFAEINTIDIPRNSRAREPHSAAINTGKKDRAPMPTSNIPPMADGFSENAGEIVFEDEPAESAATRPTNNKILDAKERKRNQNRIAQRTYRKSTFPTTATKGSSLTSIYEGRNQKQRLRALEEALNIGLFKNADLDNTRNPSPEQDQFWVLPINDGFQASTSAPPVLDLLPSPQSAIGREEVIDTSLNT
jgi:hypothetical protein